jgi:hypothetical protein
MILYSWKKVFSDSKGNTKEILRRIYYITYTPIPKNKEDPFYEISRVNWAGSSYLINPEALFNLKKSEGSLKELAEYVGLASFRSYAEYKASKIKTLDLIKSPLSQDALNNNRLLEVRGNKIHFLLEDTEI